MGQAELRDFDKGQVAADLYPVRVSGRFHLLFGHYGHRQSDCLPLLGTRTTFDNAAALEILDWEPTAIEDTVIEMHSRSSLRLTSGERVAT